jgi:hypothetical protein
MKTYEHRQRREIFMCSYEQAFRRALITLVIAISPAVDL